jgi:acetyl-CoA C-acetyltransferase
MRTNQLSPSTPALAGAAQVIQRPGDWTNPAEARGPIELMVEAARAAADDAGSARLLEQVGLVGVVAGTWPHRDAGRLVADLIGAPQAATAVTVFSGSSSQEMVGIVAERIAAGELEVALLVGGEAQWSTQRLRRLGVEPEWITAPGDGTPETIGRLPEGMIDEMRAISGPAALPYALFEDSLRLSRGDSMATHRDHISQLWAGFAAVAAGNPFAWDRSAKSAAEIRDATPDNRMVMHPYTKALAANNTVDMASAVIMCSVAAAAAAGVSSDRLVFPHVVAASQETSRIACRDHLHTTPGLAAAGTAALNHVGLRIDDIDHVDLYACFPSIVAMSTAALGLDPGRPLTITGGLGFAGAPLANSSGQAIAALVPLVRAGGWGLIHANGGLATKHAFGIYSADPPTQFSRIDAQPSAQLNPRRRAGLDWSGEGTVEAATVSFDRSGPTYVVAAVRTPDDARALVRSTDADLMTLAVTEGLGGLASPLPGATRLDDD